MKLVFCLWVLAFPVLQAAMEVRAYRMSKSELDRVCREVIEGEATAAEEFQSEPFKSSFFEQGDRTWSYSKPMKQMLGKEFSGQAIYLEGKKLLVMRAKVDDHDLFGKIANELRPVMLRVKVTVFKGTLDEKWPLFYLERPGGLEQVASLSCLVVPGELASAAGLDGELKVNLEGQVDTNDELIEVRLDVQFREEGDEDFLSLRTGYTLSDGVGYLQEVGSSDGNSSFFLGLEVERVTLDGISLTEWVLNEKGQVFLKVQHLNEWREVRRIVEEAKALQKKNKDFLLKVIRVPSGWVDLISPNPSSGPWVDDPFAPDDPAERKAWEAERRKTYEGDHPELKNWRPGILWDVRANLIDNGVEFRPGDFAVHSKKGGVLIAKVSPIQMELLDALTMFGENSPRLILLELTQWQGGKPGQKGGDRLVRKLAATAVPGQSAEVVLGKDLAGEFEAQIDQNDQIIETRIAVAKRSGALENPDLETALILRNGKEFLLQEETINGQRRAWVVKARIVAIPDDAWEELGR